jgi:hypothetical protein
MARNAIARPACSSAITRLNKQAHSADVGALAFRTARARLRGSNRHRRRALRPALRGSCSGVMGRSLGHAKGLYKY